MFLCFYSVVQKLLKAALYLNSFVVHQQTFNCSLSSKLRCEHWCKALHCGIGILKQTNANHKLDLINLLSGLFPAEAPSGSPQVGVDQQVQTVSKAEDTPGRKTDLMNVITPVSQTWCFKDLMQHRLSLADWVDMHSVRLLKGGLSLMVQVKVKQL